MNLTQDPPPKTPLRIFTIGDPHFKESNPGQTKSMTKRIVEIARERKPDLIICLGDVLDRHAKLHTDPLCEAIDFFRQLSEIAHLCILIGNHDRRTNTDFLSDRHPFTAVKYWKNVTIAETVKVKNINGHMIPLVPYVWPGRFVEALDTYSFNESQEWSQNDPASYLVSILGEEAAMAIQRKVGLNGLSEIAEIVFNSQKSEETRIAENNPSETDSPEEQAPISVVIKNKEDGEGSVGTELALLPDYSQKWWWKSSIIFAHQEFRGAKMGAIISEVGDRWPLNGPLVISGHIHDHQKVQENVWYTGTPIQHGFGDTSGKTISLMSWSNSEQGWEEERIDLGLIKRKTVRMGVLDLIAWVPPKGFLLKLVISGTPGELRTLSALCKIHALRRNGIVVTIKTLADKPLLITNPNGVKYSSVSYLIALWKEVSRNERTKSWFKSIFGGLAQLDKLVSLMSFENENEKEKDFPVEVGQILDYLLSDIIPETSSGSSQSPRLVINSNPSFQMKLPVTNNNQSGITLVVSNNRV